MKAILVAHGLNKLRLADENARPWHVQCGGEEFCYGSGF